MFNIKSAHKKAHKLLWNRMSWTDFDLKNIVVMLYVLPFFALNYVINESFTVETICKERKKKKKINSFV